jgi:hypothetical protein
MANIACTRGLESKRFQAFFPGSRASGRNDCVYPAGRKNEISCAIHEEMRDNGFNIGGLAFWDGIELMDRKDQFEAEAIAAVSGPGYFSLQKLPNGALYGPFISRYEVPRSGMQSAYTIVRSHKETPVVNKRTTKEILANAEDALFTAKLGLEHVKSSDPKTRIAGVRNVVVFGRAVTNILQNLRSTEPEFDKWYAPHVASMRANPLLRYFYELRTEILKQGTLKTGASMMFTGNPMDIMRRFKPPPRAKGFFIGDNIGGSGWQVETDDGAIEKYYVTIPDDIPGVELDVHIHLVGAPDEYKHAPADQVCELYLDTLSKLLTDARRHFAGSAT